MYYLLSDMRIAAIFLLSGVLVGICAASLRLMAEFGGWSVLF